MFISDSRHQMIIIFSLIIVHFVGDGESRQHSYQYGDEKPLIDEVVIYPWIGPLYQHNYRPSSFRDLYGTRSNDERNRWLWTRLMNSFRKGNNARPSISTTTQSPIGMGTGIELANNLIAAMGVDGMKRFAELMASFIQPPPGPPEPPPSGPLGCGDITGDLPIFGTNNGDKGEKGGWVQVPQFPPDFGQWPKGEKGEKGDRGDCSCQEVTTTTVGPTVPTEEPTTNSPTPTTELPATTTTTTETNTNTELTTDNTGQTTATTTNYESTTDGQTTTDESSNESTSESTPSTDGMTDGETTTTEWSTETSSTDGLTDRTTDASTTDATTPDGATETTILTTTEGQITTGESTVMTTQEETTTEPTSVPTTTEPTDAPTTTTDAPTTEPTNAETTTTEPTDAPTTSEPTDGPTTTTTEPMGGPTTTEPTDAPTTTEPTDVTTTTTEPMGGPTTTEPTDGPTTTTEPMGGPTTTESTDAPTTSEPTDAPTTTEPTDGPTTTTTESMGGPATTEPTDATTTEPTNAETTTTKPTDAPSTTEPTTEPTETTTVTTEPTDGPTTTELTDATTTTTTELSTPTDGPVSPSTDETTSTTDEQTTTKMPTTTTRYPPITEPVVVDCGETIIYENATWQSSNLFDPELITPNMCVLTIKLNSSNKMEEHNEPICQIRLDFKQFTIAQPNRQGNCFTDNFKIFNAENNIPTICGDNPGQHLYLKPRSGAKQVRLAYKFGLSSVRRFWNIRVTLVPCCANHLLTPPDCLQYFNDYRGIVKSFNWIDSPSDYTASNHPRQLANQHYNICFETNSSAKTICYTPCQTTGLAFSISQNALRGPYRAGVGVTDCRDDFLLIANGYDINNKSQRNDRFCGTIFNPNGNVTVNQAYQTAEASTTICSDIKPFQFHYTTNMNELPLDVANNGFCLEYKQDLTKNQPLISDEKTYYSELEYN